MRYIALLLVLLVATFSVSQDNKSVTSDDGRTLLEHCGNGLRVIDTSTNHLFDGGYCMAYIRGFADGYTLAGSKRPVEEQICVPASVSLEQLMRVMKKYLEDNPNKLHQNAAILTSSALRNAFPCAPGTKR